jgi:hypothetical protein
MRVLLSTYESRGDVEPLVGLAVQLRALGAEVRVCAPPDEDFAELLARVGVPLVPVGRPMRSMVRPSSAVDASRRVSELAALFDTVAEVAEGCDALLATPRRRAHGCVDPAGQAPAAGRVVSRAQDGPDPRDRRTGDRRGRHDPHRRGGGGRDAAARSELMT